MTVSTTQLHHLLQCEPFPPHTPWRAEAERAGHHSGREPLLAPTCWAAVRQHHLLPHPRMRGLQRSGRAPEHWHLLQKSEDPARPLWIAAACHVHQQRSDSPAGVRLGGGGRGGQGNGHAEGAAVRQPLGLRHDLPANMHPVQQPAHGHPSQHSEGAEGKVLGTTFPDSGGEACWHTLVLHEC